MGAIFSWIVALVLCIFTYIGYQIYQRYLKLQVFRNLGIPGPRPDLIRGNAKGVRTGSKLPLVTMMEWQKKYGKMYGYFRGASPTLVISDFELMKRILIKDFASFCNRPKFPFSFKANSDSLIGLRDETWKNVRKTLSPTFSASKMKQLTNLMNKTVTVFCSEIDKKCDSNEEFDIYDKFQRLTLEVIGECALAMKVDCQTNEKDFMFEAVRGFMKGSTQGLTLRRLFTYFPGLAFVMKYYYLRLPVFKMVAEVLKNLAYIISKRRKETRQKTLDVLQLMLDAGHDPEVIPEDEDGVDNILKHVQRKPLTDDQIIGSSWIFLVAGFETTATALAYTGHVLATHPDVQEKVYKEILSITQDDRIPTYEDAHSLQYLDQVINESLRLYPPVVLFMTRECAHDYDLNGITIPAGMKIEIPIYSIHHDPELWPDPEKFDPDRFSPENKGRIPPLAHIPFGAGPRNCIGMRFALLEAKLTLIRLIKKYRLVPSSKTKDPPDVTVPHATYIPKNGIYLKVELRK